MFACTLKAHKLKINTQVAMTERRDGVGCFLPLHACAYAELPHHSYAMKTFIWQNRLAPALEQRIFACVAVGIGVDVDAGRQADVETKQLVVK